MICKHCGSSDFKLDPLFEIETTGFGTLTCRNCGAVYKNDEENTEISGPKLDAILLYRDYGESLTHEQVDRLSKAVDTEYILPMMSGSKDHWAFGFVNGEMSHPDGARLRQEVDRLIEKATDITGMYNFGNVRVLVVDAI